MNHDDLITLLSADQWMDIEFIKKVQQTEQVAHQVIQQVTHQVKRLLINMDKEMPQPKNSPDRNRASVTQRIARIKLTKK